MDRQAPDQWVEWYEIKDLFGVDADVFGRQLRTRSLSHPLSGVFAVLELAEIRVRRQLRVVLVGDSGLGEQTLQTLGVRPRVLRSAHAPSLPDIYHLGDTSGVERADEAGGVELVDADRCDSWHPHVR